jgi:hypothetical protein
MKKKLFQSNPDIAFWRVDLTLTIDKFMQGESSITLLLNQLPRNGYCYVSPSNGISLSTWFNLKCLNWVDPDGYIDRYEFFGNEKIFN